MVFGCQILAVAFAGLAAYFLWSDNKDGVFVAAVLSAASYFISLRFQINDRLRKREMERRDTEETEILRK